MGIVRGSNYRNGDYQTPSRAQIATIDGYRILRGWYFDFNVVVVLQSRTEIGLNVPVDPNIAELGPFLSTIDRLARILVCA